MQSASHHTLDPQDPTLDFGSKAMGIIVPGLIVAVVGGAIALFCGFRVEFARTLFYHAYLMSFLFYLTITLGSLFFVMLHHLARAGWSVTLRRLAEALSGNISLMMVLFIPIYFGLGEIYSWADKRPAEQVAAVPAKAEANSESKADESTASEPKVVAKSPQKFADLPDAGNKDTGKKTDEKTEVKPAARSPVKPVAEVSAEAEENSHGATVGHRYWLTPSMFLGRFVIYFVIWGFLVWYFRGHSILQDTTGSVSLSRSMERLAAPGMILFSFTIALASIDLIMSLIPTWYSTMIGVYFFAEAVLSSLVVITLLALGLQSCGLLRGVITVEHYQDLGKLTFGFVIFWGYIAFSQYMLIWYANMPEETQFYIPRQIGPWAAVAIALIVVHFVLPFLGLMSRHVKRTLPVFAFWLIWLLVAHAFDLFWLIMPNVFVRQIPMDKSLGTLLPDVFKTMLDSNQSVYRLSPNEPWSKFMECVNAPLTPMAIATVIGLLLFMGGLYAAWTAWLLSAARLVPVKDPRVDEALNFHNT